MYPRRGMRSTLGDALSASTINALLSQGATPQQAAALDPLIQRTPDGTTGNVDPKYASLVMHADGSIGPASDAVIPPGDSSNYWPGIFAAKRYLVLLNAQNVPTVTVGAISIPAAQAIISTYAPTPGSTTGQASSTAATSTAEQNAKTEATNTPPAPSTPQAPAPVQGVPQPTPAPYLPYGTPVTLVNGQPGYADGHGGVIAGSPPPASSSPMSPVPLIPVSYIDPSAPTIDLDPGFNLPDPTGTTVLSPTLQAAVDGGSGALASIPSWALIAGAAGLAYLLFRPRRA